MSSLRLLAARYGRWPRWCAIAVCLVLAAASALTSARTRPAARADAGVATVVAARDLPAGHVLGAHDLTTARFPAAAHPPGASTDARKLVGARLAVPIRTREAVTATRLVGHGLAEPLPPGTVASAVATDRGAAAFVRAGDIVDVLAAPSADDPGAAPSATLVAPRATVLAVVTPSGAPGDVDATVTVVIASDRASALRIAELRGAQTFSVVTESP